MTLQAFTRLKTSLNFAPFRIRAKFEPLSEPLQSGIRLVRHPLPAYPTAFLTDCLPVLLLPAIRRIIGLTEFRCSYTSNLGSVYLPVVIRRRNPRCKRINRPRTFWSERNNNISLFAVDGIYQQFTYVNPIAQPSPQPAYCSLAMPILTDKTPLAQGYIVRKLCTMPLPASHYP